MNLNIWDGKDEKKDDQITYEEACTIMRDTCHKMFLTDKVDQMKFNYTIDFVQLSQTEEYKNYAILETVNLGDTVTVRHKKLNLDLQGRVNKIAYRVNSEGNTTIDTVEIGFSRQTITDIIKTTVKQIKFAQDEIRLALNNSISGVEVELKLANDKISAVTQKDGTGMGWTLSQKEFMVACLGASGANVAINADGLTVKDGKFYLMKGSNIVFEVDLNGICNAIGGFIVQDGSASCKLGKNGITLTNESGYTTTLCVSGEGSTALMVQDDLKIGKGILVEGLSYFKDDVELTGKLRISDSLRVGGKLLEDIIDERIAASKTGA
jgi:hypothetical protein